MSQELCHGHTLSPPREAPRMPPSMGEARKEIFGNLDLDLFFGIRKLALIAVRKFNNEQLNSFSRK